MYNSVINKMDLDMVNTNWELVTQKQVQIIVAQKWCECYEIPDEDWKSVFKHYAEIKDAKNESFSI
jgi:hypothetical protein